MNPKTKIPNLVTVLIFTLITSIAWVFFSVYRALTAKPNFDVPPAVLQPLSPNLDKSTIDKVEGRMYFEDNQIPETQAVIVGSTTTTPIPTPVPTVIASPVPVAPSSTPSP